MKKIHVLLSLAAAMLTLQAVAKATSPFSDAAALKQRRAVEATVGARATDVSGSQAIQSMQQHVAKNVDAKARRVASAVAASDLKSPSLQFDYTTGNPPAFKRSVPVSFNISGTTIEIKGFGGYGKSATGTIDLTTGAVRFERQSVYESATYGNCDIVKVNPGYTTIDTTGVITGQITGNTLTLDSWTLYITSGKYKGYILDGVRVRSDFKPSNTTMSMTVVDTLGTEQTIAYPVIVEQEATNQVAVYNFAGSGKKTLVALSGDSTIAIKPQVLFETSSLRYKCYPYDPASKVYYTYKPIKGSGKGGKLTWGNWIANSTDGKYYAFISTGATIELPFKATFPAARATAGFKGSGTEDDPYLIENAADLIALSDSVNFATEIDATKKYGSKYAGAHFKQTAAINLKGYLFPPIGGCDDRIRFGGVYDGNNKAISNLTVESTVDGYAGLFGAVDTTGVLKNVRLTSPVINSGYYYTGSLVGFTTGSIENITVTGGKVVGNFCTGGVGGFVGAATNVSFTGAVTGNSQTGGVLGVSRSPLTKLVATATTVTSTATEYTTSVGGVVGFLGKERGGEITDSYFSGNVVVQYPGVMAGCILGVSTEAPVRRCFAVGQVSTTSSSIGRTSAGGIVGGVQACEITDCYFSGESIINGPQTGGLVGYNVNIGGIEGHADHSVFSRCYVTGLIKSTSTDAQSPFVGKYDPQTGGSTPVITNCYYDGQFIVANAKLTSAALSTSTMVSGEPLDSTFSTEVWNFTKGLYPRLKGIDTNASAYVSAAAAVFASTEQNVDNVAEDFTGAVQNSVKWKIAMDGALADDGHGLSVETTGAFHLNGSFSTDTIYAVNGSVQKYFYLRCAPKSRFKGDGTAESPYLIENKTDLIDLSKATVDNQLSFSGSYFLITADIDVEKDQDFKGIGIKGSSKSNYAFGGVLDGGNHTIHNVRLISCTLDEKGAVATKENNSGFVNNLKAGGVVKNLRMAADCYFEGYSHTAAFVGHNYGGDVINCRNYAPVVSHAGTVAGIVGYHNAGLIKDCYNAGHIVAGYMYAGGITTSSRGTIENCQNDGEVECKLINANYQANRLHSAGGICHTSFGTMRNVLNTGRVSAPKYVGGIMAWYNLKAVDTMAKAAVNVGILEIDPTIDPTTVGNIVGKLYYKGYTADCYYDSQLSQHKACHGTSYDGTAASTTARLTSGTPVEGLDTAYWSFAEGRYPMLRTFANEPGAQAAARSVVYFADNHRSDSIKSDAKLAKADGLKWSTVAGTAFQIKDGVLWMDPADNLIDTVVAECNGFVKRIPVVAVPDTLAAPTITVMAGTSTVVFGNDVQGATFYYTIDGSTPTSDSNSTDGEVALPAGNYTVKAIATKHNYFASPVATEQVAVTGVTDITAGKVVLTRSFVTAAGVVSPVPVEGLNIVITTYTDGSRTTEKRLMHAE